MTSAQKIQLEQSRVRQRLGEIAVADELTEEMRAEQATLEGELGDLERRFRAATLAEPEPEIRPNDHMDAELRERVELRSKARVTNWLGAALRGRQVDGAEHELAAACGAGSDIPIELFEPDPRETRREDRVVTSAPGTVGVNMAPIQPAIFAPSIAAKMGIDMPRVDSGTFAQARINASLSADARTKGDDAEATVATFATTSAQPKRVSARLEMLAEDIAAAGVANFEAALRENLSMALSAELDDQMINGDGQAPNLSGLFKALGVPAAQGAELTFQNGIQTLAALIDGLWATEVSHIVQIVGVDTYRKMAAILAPNVNAGDRTLAATLATMSGGLSTNDRMPAKVAAGGLNKNQAALVFRNGRSGMRTAVCPHWGRIGITDIYSGSARAETSVTFHVLLGDVLVIQPGAYAAEAYQVDA